MDLDNVEEGYYPEDYYGDPFVSFDEDDAYLLAVEEDYLNYEAEQSVPPEDRT